MVIGRARGWNSEKSSYECLHDEVVLLAYDPMNLDATDTNGFEATTCGEFIKRKWDVHGLLVLKEISNNLAGRSDGMTCKYFSISSAMKKNAPCCCSPAVEGTSRRNQFWQDPAKF